MLGLLLVRLALAGVFAVAAAGKLADRRGTREAVAGFGAPPALVGPIAVALPIAELAVAAALLVPATAWAGAVGAIVLLAIFSVAITANLARGRRPDCHCFGQVRSQPVGAQTLARNGALALGAGLIVALGATDPGPSAVAWAVSTPAVALAVGLAIGVTVAVAVAFAALRRHGRSLRRVDELEAALREAGLEVPEPEEPPKLPIGSDAPAFPGMDELLRARRPLLLIFTSPGCGPCRTLAPKLERWREDHAELVGVTELSYEDDPGLAEAFGVEGTPAAIVLGAAGTVESRVAHGPERIEALFDETLLAALPPPPDVGEELPDLRLETLDAERVSLRAALDPDRETLLLFWNPDCGFCDAMRDDLRDLESAPLNGHPSLLVVAAGDRDAVLENRFRAPVLLDQASMASASVGAGGTPTAVLVDRDGRVRSKIAGGREAVLALAGREPTDKDSTLEVLPAGRRSQGKDEG